MQAGFVLQTLVGFVGLQAVVDLLNCVGLLNCVDLKNGVGLCGLAE